MTHVAGRWGRGGAWQGSIQFSVITQVTRAVKQTLI